MSASIITRCDAPPVFEPAEHDLDFVALFIEGFAKFRWMAPAFSRRNAGLNAFGAQGAAELI